MQSFTSRAVEMLMMKLDERFNRSPELLLLLADKFIFPIEAMANRLKYQQTAKETGNLQEINHVQSRLPKCIFSAQISLFNSSSSSSSNQSIDKSDHFWSASRTLLDFYSYQKEFPDAFEISIRS